MNITRWWRRPPRESDIRDELQFHLDEEAADHDAAGVPSDRSARAARLNLGNPTLIGEDIRTLSGWTTVEHVIDDVRYALRRLVRAPVFTTFSVLTLALGIGVATAVWSALAAVLGPPPGVAAPDEVAIVRHFREGSGPIVNLSWPDFQALEARQTVFSSLAGWSPDRQPILTNGQTITGWNEFVSGEYFRVFGVRMAAGRALHPSDDRPGAPPVVVISHHVWQRAFGGSPAALGQHVRVSGITIPIVGVTDSAFTGNFNGGLVATNVWIPMNVARDIRAAQIGNMDFSPLSLTRRWLFVAGRMAADQTFATSQMEVTRIAQQLDAESPLLSTSTRRAPWDQSRLWELRTVNGRVLGVPARVATAMVAALMGLVAIFLLIACSNLGNLALARLVGEQGQFAVRAALGASRWRLVRQASAEVAILGLAGGFAGLGVAALIMNGLATPIGIGFGDNVQVLPAMNGHAFAASVAATAVALIVAGLAPALRATRTDVRHVLAHNTPAASARWRGRRYLITAQVAASVLLVSIAALCAEHIRRESEVETGMDLDRLAVAQVDFGQQQYDATRSRQIVDTALEQLTRQPAVESVAASSGLPPGLFTPTASLRLPGSTVTRRFPTGQVAELLVSTPSIFKTLGVPVVRGRGFDARDTQGSVQVIVLSQSAADDLFEDIDPIGRQVLFTRRRVAGQDEQPTLPMTVVGVARDTVTEPGTKGVLAYVPLAQHDESRLVVTVRSRHGSEPLIETLRSTVAAIDPTLALSNVGTGEEVVTPSNTFLQMLLLLSGTAGGMALVMALAGLYGVMSQVVTLRTREIGIRLALGASAARTRYLIATEGMSPVWLGLIAGACFSALAGLSIRPMFPGLVAALDPWTLGTLAALFSAAGAIACLLPARRVTQIEPTTSIRQL